jgi:hypothetical protein
MSERGFSVAVGLIAAASLALFLVATLLQLSSVR